MSECRKRSILAPLLFFFLQPLSVNQERNPPQKGVDNPSVADEVSVFFRRVATITRHRFVKLWISPQGACGSNRSKSLLSAKVITSPKTKSTRE